MGFGKFLGNLLQAGAQTIALPLDIVKDVVTMGGACTGDEPATLERLKRVKEELEDAYDELDQD
jgi:hypothetical protein